MEYIVMNNGIQRTEKYHTHACCNDEM